MNVRRPRNETPPATDAELMTRLAKGEIGALGELYDRYHEPVRRFLVRATGGAEDVDDLVHQTFLAAARSAARYDGRASCRPWLVGIAVQHLRRRAEPSRGCLRPRLGRARQRPVRSGLRSSADHWTEPPE